MNYDNNTIDHIELYDLSKDISETKNVAAQYPEVVTQIEILANDMRIELGDNLNGQNGKENRPIGRLQ